MAKGPVFVSNPAIATAPMVVPVALIAINMLFPKLISQASSATPNSGGVDNQKFGVLVGGVPAASRRNRYVWTVQSGLRGTP